MPLARCPFAGALGEPGKGIHSRRIFGVDLLNLLMSVFYYSVVRRELLDFAHYVSYGWKNSALFIRSSDGVFRYVRNYGQIRLGPVRLQNKNERGRKNWCIYSGSGKKLILTGCKVVSPA